MILKLKDGEIKIELFEDVAPNHVKRIKQLAKDGKYDGVVFHRVIDGFMAQTGDVQFGNSSNDQIVSLSVIDNDKINKNVKKSKDEKSEFKAKEKFVLSITENGYGKKTFNNEYRVTNRGGKGIIGIVNSPRNGSICSSFPVIEGDDVMISTNKGRVIRVAVKEIRTAGRNTQGVRIIKLSGDEKVVSAIKIDDNLE